MIVPDEPDAGGRDQIRGWADYRRYLQADLNAHNLKKWGLLAALKHPEVRYQRLLRLVELLNSYDARLLSPVKSIIRYRLRRMSVRTGLTFPAGVAGPGLSIAHYGSIVVNSRCRIGKYLRIHSATNIGISRGGVPTIGDYVYIGPGAVIYGAITIGDRSVIGANAVVNKDVPAGVTVAGAPARIISETGSDSVMPTWFPNYSSVRQSNG